MHCYHGLNTINIIMPSSPELMIFMIMLMVVTVMFIIKYSLHTQKLGNCVNSGVNWQCLAYVLYSLIERSLLVFTVSLYNYACNVQ